MACTFPYMSASHSHYIVMSLELWNYCLWNRHFVDLLIQQDCFLLSSSFSDRFNHYIWYYGIYKAWSDWNIRKFHTCCAKLKLVNGLFYTELRNTHIPRYYRTRLAATNFELLIHTKSEIKIRNVATFLYQYFRKTNSHQ